MSDDVWRSGRQDDDEFGDPHFADDALPTDMVPAVDDGLSFGPNDTGSLPHWTEPPTGELPKLFAEDRRDDELDVWSTFTTEQPAWKEDSGGYDRSIDEPTEDVGRRGLFSDDASDDVTRRGLFSDDEGYLDPDQSDALVAPVPGRRETTRISIGTGPDETGARPTAGGRPRSAPSGPRAGRAARSDASRRSTAGVGGRDMPTAIAVGLIIAAAFLGALMWKPIAVLAIVVLITGLAAVEYFDKVTEKGYRPATLIGIIACIAAPLAAYWVGEAAITLVLVIAFIAAATTFIGADSLQSAPMPNMAITTLGIMWIGLMGAYAALLADISNAPSNIGTDTLFIIAVGVVANDVGALFVGSAAGRTPLRAWISPNKSVEGLIGGALLTLIAVYVVSLQSDTWNQPLEVLILGLAIAVLAPIGDLTESMFKRNLDVKDFGTLVRGHGGILDRFDGFLFVLPAAYYLLQVLEPWTSA
jgi:phosphatidate cytidylyltransferase